MRISNLLLTSDPLPKEEKPRPSPVIKADDERAQEAERWTPPDLERR